MKKQITVAIASMLTLTACQQSTTGKPVASHDQNKPAYTQSKNQTIFQSSDQTSSPKMVYIKFDNIPNKTEPLAEHRYPAILDIYNNCLSIKTLDTGEFSTLVVPNANEILFDDNQNIIGLLNKESKRKILIGDKISLSGTNTVDASASTKPVPKDCSQELLITAAVE